MSLVGVYDYTNNIDMSWCRLWQGLLGIARQLCSYIIFLDKVHIAKFDAVRSGGGSLHGLSDGITVPLCRNTRAGSSVLIIGASRVRHER